MKISYILIILLAFTSLSLNAQTANFSFTTPNNLFCSPQVITFTANANGIPVSYIWDFGDGQSGSSTVENHLYDYPGTYNVTFTAVYNNSASSITKSVVINPTPVVSLTANNLSLCQPGIVIFTASASGTISSYEWNFGDATPLQTTASNITNHNFTSYGTFNVTVKAIASTGCTASSGTTIQIARFPISVSVTPSNGCLPANATLSSVITLPPGDGLQNIIWNFGDGTPNVTGNSPSIMHVYNTTNPITSANVNITTNQGCTNQFTLSQFAYGIPPTNTNAYTTALRDTFCGSETIQFYGYADSANSYKWDFGDGTIMITTTTLITHKYNTLGNKTVIVTPSYNGCNGPTRNLNIYITGVIALYTYGNSCNNKTTYNFLNNSLGAISAYEWTYTDMPGFYETTNYNPTHTFPSPATSLVKLTVIDNVTGCRDSLISTIYTATPALVADKINVCRDSSITYTVQNTYPSGSGHNYEFHLNGNILNIGGSTNYTLNPRNYGIFNDYVVIMDTLPGTCNDTLTLNPIKVRGPFVTFTNPQNLCIDTLVPFTNNSYPWFASDNIIKWKWDFGDGQKDSVQNPVPHLYQVPGLHLVKLEATDVNGCKQQFDGAVRIAGLPSIKVFPAIDTLCLGQSAVLMAYTSDSLIWVTTTNINCTSCDTVMVNPTVTTDYIAMAISGNGCKNYDTATVKVFGPINLIVTPSVSSVCPGTSIQFNSNTPGTIMWSPATYLNNTTIQNPISIPDTNIIYTIIVKDSVGCFADTATATIMVFSKPLVNAGPDQFIPYNGPFIISPIYSPNVLSYLWTPSGNLTCTNCPVTSGISLGRQQYKIEITDRNGCKGKDSVTIFPTCEKSNLLLPTAFTPNGDGRNETFYPITRGYKIIKSFTIFNRNGAKVFERKEFQPNIQAEGWNGIIKGGKGENTQSYVWIIEGICDTGMSIVSKGTVILIR